MSLVLLGEATALSTAPADAVLLLPFGAHEQHGPHLPQATDTLIVDAVAREGGQLARAQVALAPTVAYGVSPHHLGLGTTLSLRPRTLLSTVEDLLESAVTGGFSRALLLNGHGGNAGLLATAANEAVANRQILCAFASYWDLAQHDIAALRRSPHGGMGHACELETALLLHLAAHLVDTQAIPADNLGRPGPCSPTTCCAQPP